MSITALTNSTSPNTVNRATADGDPFDRDHLNLFAENFDLHDHTSGKNLGIGRVQTSSTPAQSGQVRVNGDSWQWWGSSAAAVRTAADLESAQTVSGQKVFSANVGVGVTPSAWGAGARALQVGQTGAVFGSASTAALSLRENSYNDGTNNRAIVAAAATALDFTAGVFQFYSAASVAAGAAQTLTERMRLDLGGNVGVGVIPSTWGSGYRAIQVGSAGVVDAATTGTSVDFKSNSYYDGTNNRAVVAGAGAAIQLQDGALSFYTAPSVAASAAQTFATRLTISNDGLMGFNAAPVATALHKFGGSLSAGASTDAYGANVESTLTKTASTGNLIGLRAGPVVAANAAVTATSAIGLYAVITGTNSGTISSVEALRVDSPGVAGGTITNQYVIKHGNTAANLSTAGTWADASAEFNSDGSRRKWRRGLLRDRLDALAAVRSLAVRVYAYGEDDPEEFAGVFAEELNDLDPALSDRTTVSHGGWALALAAVQQLAERVASLEAR